RHSVKLGGFLVLNKSDPPLGFDLFQTVGAIDAIAGKDDPNGAISLVGSKTFKESIDGQIGPVRATPRLELENALHNGQCTVGGDNINVIWLDEGFVFDLGDLHPSPMGKELGQLAFMSWIQMLDEDKCHTRLGREFVQQLRKSFVTACGRAN